MLTVLGVNYTAAPSQNYMLIHKSKQTNKTN